MLNEYIDKKEAVEAILKASDAEAFDMWDKGYNRGMKYAAHIVEKIPVRFIIGADFHKECDISAPVKPSEERTRCSMRHENGNCLPCGGFCTAVNEEICKALHNAFQSGYQAHVEDFLLESTDDVY